MHFTEDMFEQAVIELFENMGYTHTYAPDMERDYSSPLLDAVLQDSLVKLNKGLPLDAINEAISKLRNFDTGSLSEVPGEIAGLPRSVPWFRLQRIHWWQSSHNG